MNPILDAIIARSAALLRVEASYRRDIVRLLLDAQDEILKRLIAADATLTQRARLNALLADVRRLLGETYDSIAARMAQHTLELLQAEALWTVTGINRAIGVDLLAKVADLNTLREIAGDLLIQGAPSAEWWSRQAQDTAFRFTTELRLGIAQQETIAELVRRIRGAPAKGIAGVMPVSRRNAEALVRSSVATAQNAARLATYRANADVLTGVQQISTLDGRTTPVCIAYSGAAWKLDEKHTPIPPNTLPFISPNGPTTGTPRHWNCRSTLMPVVDLAGLPPGMRASMDGPVAADLSFADWLRGKPRDFQDDLLGRGRADLWRRGRISLQELLDATGRELTLEELRRQSR